MISVDPLAHKAGGLPLREEALQRGHGRASYGFFYGLFMDPEALHAKGLRPYNLRQASGKLMWSRPGLDAPARQLGPP